MFEKLSLFLPDMFVVGKSIKKKETIVFTLAILVVAGLIFFEWLELTASISSVFISYHLFIKSNLLTKSKLTPWSFAGIYLFVSGISSLVYLLIFIIFGSDFYDPISVEHLGLILIFSLIGLLIFIGMKFQQFTPIQKQSAKEGIAVGVWILLLFYFGNMERFSGESFPEDDLNDFIYFFSTVLIYWSLYLLIFIIFGSDFSPQNFKLIITYCG